MPDSGTSRGLLHKSEGSVADRRRVNIFHPNRRGGEGLEDLGVGYAETRVQHLGTTQLAAMRGTQALRPAPQ